MALRGLVFFAILLACTSVGLGLGGGWGAAGGAWVGALAWLAADLAMAARALRWLRRPARPDELLDPPELPGLWGAVIDRVRRLLRARDQQVAEAGQRMQSFLAAIQASPNGVTLLDEANRITWCNQTAAGHFGFDAQRDQLQLVGNLVRDPDFAAYLAAGDFSHEVVINGRAATSSRLARVSAQLHPYGDGQKLLLSRDVTALEQADTMRRDFVANVSHEIRTPLTVMSGFVETLQTLDLNADEQKRYLSLMAIQAVRMQGLVEDLLTLSRLEGSPVPSFVNSLPLESLLAACESEARGLSQTIANGAPLHVIEFQTHPLLAHAMLLGESRELQSALSNLVNNAVRYTPAGGHIDVSVDQGTDGSLVIAVRDTGAGIAAEHLPRLTERFYRVDRSRSRESGGTGLGLAIVKHVMQRHGGSLSITSELEHGSCFKLTFPANRWRAKA